MAQNKNAKIYANKQSSSANLTKFLPKKMDSKSSTNSNQAASDGEMDDLDEARPAKPEVHEEPLPTVASSLVEAERKKRGLLSRKVSYRTPGAGRENNKNNDEISLKSYFTDRSTSPSL